MTAYRQVQQILAAAPRTWLFTGVAGFIGYNLLEVLLKSGHSETGLDRVRQGLEDAMSWYVARLQS